MNSESNTVEAYFSVEHSSWVRVEKTPNGKYKHTSGYESEQDAIKGDA